jgi:rSAM/selenodomain-associated transferase 2
VTASEAQPAVSVIIPVLNERETIQACLDQFLGLKDVQVIVVDGGSHDGTQTSVEATGALLVHSEAKGRFCQLNAGTELATAEVLVFLHADCILPSTWQDDVAEVLSESSFAGGRFRLGIDERTLCFRLIAFFSTLRSRLLGITYGDQAIFVRRSVFDRIGGYPSRLIFEDSEFCDKVCRVGRFGMTRTVVMSSARRWREWGVFRTVLRMWILRLLYSMSVSDEQLANWYRNVR